MWRNSEIRYRRIAMLLHWTIAGAILFMFWLGPYMAGLPETDPIQFPLFQLHKSIGLTILVLTFVRTVWRFSNLVPALPGHLPHWERMAARAVHHGLYALMIAAPLFGWASVSAAPLGVPTMWFGLFEWPDIPFLGDLRRVQKQLLVRPLEDTHAVLAFLMMGLVALHIAAALKHHFHDRDSVLRHMLP
jgi:cytochrome b561